MFWEIQLFLKGSCFLTLRATVILHLKSPYTAMLHPHSYFYSFSLIRA